MTSLRECIDQKCKSCGYDPFSSGGWKEQIALCCTVDCAHHPVRPVPRDCRINGEFNWPAINALAKKLEAADRRQATR